MNNSPDLSDPQKLVMADVVTKNSKTGITSNKRLLVIKKGHLYYYSTVPKNYKNDIKFLQSYHELPKCSIQILNIKKINGFEDSSNYFSIEFEARHMMQREDIRKTMTLEEFNFAPKNKKQTITWQFTCDNQMIKKRWVHVLQELHTHYGKEKVNIQKFFENINKKEDDREQNVQPAIRSSLKVPWREDQIKKNASTESLKKQLRASQVSQVSLNRSPSPSNGKKSSNQAKKNEAKMPSPDSQQDIVESFMKIEKTKSMHEPNIESIIKQQSEDIRESSRKEHEPPKRSDNSPEKADEEQRKFNSMFVRKDTITFDVSEEPTSPMKESKIIAIEQQQPQIKKTSSIQQIKPPNPPQSPPQDKKKIASPPKLKTRISEPQKRIQNLFKMPSLQQRTSMQSQNKTTNILYNVDSNTNFYDLIYFGSNREYSFERRIEAQKKLNTLIGNFTDKSVKSYMEFINTKSQGHSGRFVEERMGEGLSTLQIGYSRYKIGYVNTQSVTINGKQKIFYNQAAIKSIKRQLSIYNKLFSLITGNIRSSNKPNPLNTQTSLSLSLSLSRSQAYAEGEPKSTSLLGVEKQHGAFVEPSHLSVSLRQLRVPLCTYVEYRGICAIAYDDAHKNKETQITDKEQLREWKQLIRFLGFNNNYFQFRSMETAAGQIVIAYITSAGSDIYLSEKPSKHHNVTFESPMNVQFIKRAKKEGASTSLQSLGRYIKSIEMIQDTSIFVCPREEILITLQYCYLCKYFRKFYRASHAEIDELNFVNLLLKGDSKMNKLFESSGFQFTDKKTQGPVLGIFFQFLLYYLGISCKVDTVKCQKYANLTQIGIISKQQNKTNEQNCVKQVKTFPRVIGYCLDTLQLYQTFARTDHYITLKAKELAQKALQNKQSAYFQNSYQLSSYPWQASSQCLFAAAELNYIENDYITSIAKCKQYMYTILSSDEKEEGTWQLPTPSCCISIYFLMIKCYSKFSKQKFNETLKQVIQSIIYNFGQQSSMMVTMFSFIALVLCGISEYGQAENYLKIAIKMGEKLYTNYGKGKLSELYLDLSRVLLQLGHVQGSNQYIGKAELIINKTGTHRQKANLLLYILETILKMPKSIQWQQRALQTLHKAQNLITKQTTGTPMAKQYHTLQYQLGIKYNSPEVYEKAIDSLWKLDSSCKVLAIQYTYRVVGHKFQAIKQESEHILEKWSLSREKSLLKIEENLRNYKNLMDMLVEVFTEEDLELVSAFLKLLPPEVYRSF